MHPRKFTRHILGLSFFLILAFTGQAGFCGYTADCSQAPTWVTGSWTTNDCLNFEKANDNAAEPATPGKISNTLLAIVPPRQYAGSWPEDPINRVRLNGGKITWEGTPGNSRIRVAAFMDKQTYLDWYYPCMFGGKDKGGVVHPGGGEATSVLTRSLWVSVVPELRNFFWTQFSACCPPSKERTVQLIGLNPRRAYDVILEMWVDQEDLYRPTPDPGTTGHTAELAVQLDETIHDNVSGKDYNKWAFSNPYLFFSTDQTYQMWFAKNAATTYYNPSAPWNTAPWTRLGYTYDWGNEACGGVDSVSDNHVGTSEFMIKTHPNLDGHGTTGVYATYIRAIKAYDRSWHEYFRCRWRRDTITEDNVPDADVNLAAEGK
jgi:hypothetical protein